MRKRLVASHLTVALISILLTWFLAPKIYMLEINQNENETNGLGNPYEVIGIVNGKVVFDIFGHNTFTDIGKTANRDLKMGNLAQNSSYGKIGKWWALSNDASPSASWTKLPNEATTAGAGRKVADTYVTINSTSFNSTVTFTFTGTITLQTAGLQWDQTASSDNNLYAVFSFTQTTFNNGDQFIGKYYNQAGGS